MGGTRLLLIAAAILVPAFSGCLDRLEESFGVPAENEKTPAFEPIPSELYYQTIPGEAGAYQFQVPPDADNLRFEKVESEDDDEEEDDRPYNGGEAEDEESEADSRHRFTLYSADGTAFDPRDVGDDDDEEFRFELARPAPGPYVLVLHDGLPFDVRIALEPGDSGAWANLNAAVLPLSHVAHRTVLFERAATDEPSFSGKVQLPFPPSYLEFSIAGAGRSFSGFVSSRTGLVYEQHEESFLVVGGLGFPGPACCRPGSFERENADGLVYTWDVSTDVVGTIALVAHTFQPAPPSLAVAAIEARSGDGWDLEAGAASDSDDEEHFYTGEAAAGEGAYVFTLPGDAHALLLQAGDASCDEWQHPSCAASVTKVSLYDESGARVGLYAIREDGRLRLQGLEAGDYALFVHSGRDSVRVGVVGPPPASARLHEQKLQTLATGEVSLAQTRSATTVPMAVDGIPLEVTLEANCPSDRGTRFYAIATSPNGVAFAAPPDFYYWSLPCDQPPLHGGVAEGLVPGDYKLTVESFGGFGTLRAKVLGLTAIGSAHDGGNGTTPALPMLESLIG